jgi:hypothetical protein
LNLERPASCLERQESWPIFAASTESTEATRLHVEEEVYAGLGYSNPDCKHLFGATENMVRPMMNFCSRLLRRQSNIDFYDGP